MVLYNVEYAGNSADEATAIAHFIYVSEIDFATPLVAVPRDRTTLEGWNRLPVGQLSLVEQEE